MSEHFRLLLRRRVIRQLQALSDGAAHDPRGPAAAKLSALLSALEAVEAGQERAFDGERLGYSPQHYDLRDCAEIKVPLVQEFSRDGRPLGPSHRMIYREFFAPDEEQLPIREVLCCEPRANSLAFEITAHDLGRIRTIEVDDLRDLPNVVPARGPNKDPQRPSAPPRLALPPDIAAALATMATSRPAHSRSGSVSVAIGAGPATAVRGRNARDTRREESIRSDQRK